ncbi:hypothetical protein FH608_015175 [Nonomuraea phyllanthi]|uniref:Uncharacterized protein n=1 Tax=Nonomuraea phyllanthi TaxID=2219224 RepID=A0A5C4WKP9_9ACTN|nr:hypothetical protein [Nonomuraea phyllanthi]KAB8194546.1 hypothetical protein FH608_015175 [Nonomuraea phyllanthi]
MNVTRIRRHPADRTRQMPMTGGRSRPWAAEADDGRWISALGGRCRSRAVDIGAGRQTITDEGCLLWAGRQQPRGALPALDGR